MGSLAKQLNQEIIENLSSILGTGYVAIINEQVKQSRFYLQEIEQFLQENNSTLAMKRAHALKSSCNQVGLQGLGDIARELEFVCRTDAEKNVVSVEAHALLNRLRNSMDDAIQHLLDKIS